MPLLTSKHDLRTKIYGVDQYIPGDPSARELALGISSGTTGGVPTIVVHHRENDMPEESIPHKWNAYGKENTTLRLASSQQNVLRLVTEIWSLAQPVRFLMITPEDIEHVYSQNIIEEFKPTQIDAQPSLLVHLLAELQKRKAVSVLSYLKENIRAIAFAGERMTKTQRELITTLLPNATIFSDYSLSETPWWFACTCPVHPHVDTSIMCISPNFTDRVKIHKPDKNEIGEILVWTRELGWYRTGDSGKIETQECACGSTKVLTVFGRINYDIVPCVGALFLISEVDRVCDAFKRHISDYLVEVKEELDEERTIRGKVHLTVVPTTALQEDPTAKVRLKKKFEENLFVTPTRTLANMIDEGLFLSSTVSFAETIPRSGTKRIHLRRS